MLIAIIAFGFVLFQTPVVAQKKPFWDVGDIAEGFASYDYRGSVSFLERKKVKTDSISWSMRIDEIFERGSIRAWNITGHPIDLAWYKPGMRPIPRTIVEVAGRTYYLCPASVFNRVKDMNDSLKGLVWESEIVLDLPLSKGRQFGEAQQLKRKDGLYVWRVTEVRDSVRILQQGLHDTLRVHTVVYRALNSVMTTEWVQGLGLIRFKYHHNGTPADCELVYSRHGASGSASSP
jgi:hypothetical protein